MKHYFIDFENVHCDGFAGIEEIDKDVIIYLLYTDTCKNISLDVLEKVIEKEIRIKMYKTETGKNALDFQLSSLLGYTIKEHEGMEDEYFIISKDTGYDAVVEFWKHRDIKIFRAHDISGNITAQEPVKKETSPDKKKKSADISKATKEEVLQYLAVKDYSDAILNIVNSFKTKSAISNGLNKMFKDGKKSSAIYKKLKPLLKEKGKT